MHRRHHLALARRQQELLQHSASLRDALGQQSQPLKAPLALVDQLRGALHWLGRHPVLPLLMLTWLELNRPKRVRGGLSLLYAVSTLMLRVWPWRASGPHRPS